MSATKPNLNNVFVYSPLSFCANPDDYGSSHGYTQAQIDALWLWTMEHIDWCQASSFFQGLYERNASMILGEYYLFNTVDFYNQTAELNSLAAYASAHGYNLEDAFLHFYSDNYYTITATMTSGSTTVYVDVDYQGSAAQMSIPGKELGHDSYGYKKIASRSMVWYSGSNFHSTIVLQTAWTGPSGTYAVKIRQPGYGGGSAATLFDSRMCTAIWGTDQRYLYNFQSELFRKWKAEYHANILTNGNPQGLIPDGLMFDEAGVGPCTTGNAGWFPYSDGNVGGQVREWWYRDVLGNVVYKTMNAGKNQYATDYCAAAAEFNSLLPLNTKTHSHNTIWNDAEDVNSWAERSKYYSKSGMTEYWINSNLTNHVYSNYLLARDFARTASLFVQFFRYGVTWWNAIITATDKFPTPLARNQMFFLSVYLCHKFGYHTYFAPLGFSSDDWNRRIDEPWIAAFEYDFGQAVDATPFIWNTGTDNGGSGYEVWARRYENCLVLMRPSGGMNTYTPSLTLPGTYKLLNADGTLGSNRTSISLAGGEGVVLVNVTPGTPVAPFAISYSVDKVAAMPDETVDFNISYTNNTGISLSNVYIQATVPRQGNITMISGSGYTVGNNGIEWLIGNIASGGTGRVTFQIRVKNTGGNPPGSPSWWVNNARPGEKMYSDAVAWDNRGRLSVGVNKYVWVKPGVADTPTYILADDCWRQDSNIPNIYLATSRSSWGWEANTFTTNYSFSSSDSYVTWEAYRNYACGAHTHKIARFLGTLVKHNNKWYIDDGITTVAPLRVRANAPNPPYPDGTVADVPALIWLNTEITGATDSNGNPLVEGARYQVDGALIFEPYMMPNFTDYEAAAYGVRGQPTVVPYATSAIIRTDSLSGDP